MNTRTVARSLPLLNLFAVAVLVGCSSGGGEDPQTVTAPPAPPPPPAVEVPLEAAFGNVVANGFNASFTVTGWRELPGVPREELTGTGQFTLTPAHEGQVCGLTPTLRAERTIDALPPAGEFINDVRAYRENHTIVLLDTGDRQYRFEDVPYPVTVKAGDTGVTGTGIAPSCGSGIAEREVITGNYSVAEDTATSLLVTFTETTTNEISGRGGVMSTTYRIDTEAHIALVTITTTRSSLGTVYQQLVYTF